MQITMQRTRPAWPAKTTLRMTLECSRIADDEWTFCREQEADAALFLQETRTRKIRRRKLADYCPEQGDHKQPALKHKNKQSGSKCTNHK